MTRFLAKTAFAGFALAWLVYVSPLGFSLCLGWMTHDLPPLWAPIFKAQWILGFCSIGAVPIVALAFWLEKRTPARLMLGLAASLVAPSLFVWRPIDGWRLRRQGLAQSAARLNALNRALAVHRAKTGVYPVALDELNLDQTTGMVCYPKVRYQRASPNAAFSGYELKVETGFGLGFDSFFFWPNQTYPQRIYGGTTEIIRATGGNWAYVHE